jgi:ubiquinone/menaquinone biosynthesis C-methylase UbiE
MQKYILIILCVFNVLNGMEQQIITREPREWNAEAYDEGNSLQTNTFLQFITKNRIEIEKKNILSAGCGTGRIENILAEKAEHIHGFDASKNMIDFAQNKYGHIKNLSFEHCFAEDFKSQKLYQLALASFCIHWFADKKLAFQRINDSLEINGELFGTLPTSNNPKPINLVVAAEMMSFLESIVSFFSGKNILDLIGASYPSNEELDTMLHETGFEIIKREEQCFDCIMTRDELKQLEWPIVSSRPIIKYIPNRFIQPLFEDYIDRIIAKLPKVDNEKFVRQTITTIIHARKIKK